MDEAFGVKSGGILLKYSKKCAFSWLCTSSICLATERRRSPITATLVWPMKRPSAMSPNRRGLSTFCTTAGSRSLDVIESKSSRIIWVVQAGMRASQITSQDEFDELVSRNGGGVTTFSFRTSWSSMMQLWQGMTSLSLESTAKSCRFSKPLCWPQLAAAKEQRCLNG